MPDRFKGFESFVESAMKDWRVPGLALSIVEGGRAIYSEVLDEYGDTLIKYTFRTDSKGVVPRINAPLEPAVKDIVLTRVQE
jgi:hypothetical protein